MTQSGKIAGISISSQTRGVVKDSLETAPEAERRALKKLFKLSASTDHNRHLSLEEAEKAANAYQQAKAAGLTASAAYSGLAKTISAQQDTGNVDGIRNHFSSVNKKLDEVLINSFKEVVAKADGKPVDINAMIFSFTDKQVADSILELAENNPNVNFRLVTDFTQLPTSGHRQPPRLIKEAKERGLTNIEVRFKKDAAYRWDTARNRPTYHHGLSKGLNHHKGFVALIDGKPVKLMTGSYNWSESAQKNNYENMLEVDASNPANHKLLEQYQAEFVGFFNHKDSLTADQAKAWKRKVYNELRTENGLSALSEMPTPVAAPNYVPQEAGAQFDLNHFSDANFNKLNELLQDDRLTRSVRYNYATYGRFSSFDNLMERVPKLRKLSLARRNELKANLEFGEGRILINEASVSELMRGLKLSKEQATAIVAKRRAVGDFENIDQIRDIPGFSPSTFARVRERLNDDSGRAYFSARAFDASSASTGYAPVNANATTPVMNTDGVVTDEPAKLSSGVIDLFNRAKSGDTFKVAMYGLSATTPEYGALVDAAERGVAVKVVLNSAYNSSVAYALEALRVSGLPIDVRIQKSKTMHMKFGVVNDDVFLGSANFSNSAANKHSEDRFVIKNNAGLSQDYDAEFERVWAKSKPVIPD